MWRYDAARSAASPDEIAPKPVLLWSRKLPPVLQAWPLEHDQRINFDISYEPVVMGKLMFLSSPNDGGVTAFSTDTGEQVWKFYTEAPVRCAPACWKGKVYAGSDDGYLYCLDAGTGAVVWKFRGAPSDRPDRRHIGNGHLVSFWPVRGGPVVADGVVYFGAGIWSTFGVFLYALDAETGSVKWENGKLNYVARVRIDHDGIFDGGLSPQGHFLVVKDRLLVPQGRSMPAGIELATGKLIYYVQGYRKGDSRVAAHGDYAFVGTDGVLSLYDFREIGSKWVGRGAIPPEGYRNAYCTDQLDRYECPPVSYKLAQACDASSAFADNVAYGSRSGIFYACSLAKAKLYESEENFATSKFKQLKWEPPVLWQLKTPHAGLPGGAVIKAGRRVYGYAGKRLLAVENIAAEPRIAWEKDVGQTPSSLMAADNKLFVATQEGGIFCFGEGAVGKTYDGKPLPLPPSNDAWADKARQIVSASGAKSGYCVVLGLADGRLIEELLKQTELVVLGVDADQKKVDVLRRRFDAAGFYGSRVELYVAEPFKFLLPPYIASLIVSEDAKAAGFSTEVDAAKVFNILRPYGGALCLSAPDLKFADWAKGAAAANAKVKKDGPWSLLVREGALPGSAPWTHEAADAGGSFCSRDDLVKAPLGFLWYGDMNGFTQEHDYGKGVKPQVVGGCVFAIQQHAPRALFAYDAYTGRPLWRNDFKPFHARFAAMADGIYLVADGKCVVYDPQTGKTLNTFTFNKAGATTAKDLRVDGDVVVVAASDVDETKVGGPDYFNHGYFESATLVCLDRGTGAELWRRTAKNRFNNSALVLGAGMVFCADSVPASKAEKWTAGPDGVRRGEARVFALNARTGEQTWAKTISYALQPATADTSGQEDFLAYSSETGLLLVGGAGFVNALDAKSGKPVWENKRIDHAAPLILRGQTFINQVGMVCDILTGKRQGKSIWLERTSGSCNYAIAGRHLIMVRNFSASYAEIERPRQYYLRNIRSGCSMSMVPADGLLNAPNFAWGCICNYANQTSFAMVHMPEVAAWAGAEPVTMAAPGAPPPSVPSAEILPPRLSLLKIKDTVAVDISRQANRALDDEAENDGKGGWADLGSAADMNELRTGERRLGGVLFRILSGPNAIVVLKSRSRSPGDLPEKVTIPVQRKFDTLFFLHASGWCPGAGEEAFRYVIHYADGADATLKVTGDNMADWVADPVARFPQEEGTFSTVVDTVKNARCRQGSIYRMEWSAPPDRRGIEIKNIEFIGAGYAVPILLGITGVIEQ